MPRKSNRSKKSKKSKIRGGLVSRQNIERMLERERAREEEITRAQMIDEEATRAIVEAIERAFQRCMQQIETRFPNNIYTNDDYNRICNFIMVNRFELENIDETPHKFNTRVLELIDYFHLKRRDIPPRVVFNLILSFADILANESRLDIFMSEEGFEHLNGLFSN